MNNNKLKELRDKLNQIVKVKEICLYDEEIVAISQKLDRLVAEQQKIMVKV